MFGCFFYFWCSFFCLVLIEKMEVFHFVGMFVVLNFGRGNFVLVWRVWGLDFGAFLVACFFGGLI